MKHIHYDAIIAWANGDQIQYRMPGECEWQKIEYPTWKADCEYRVKPEPQTIKYRVALMRGESNYFVASQSFNDLSLDKWAIFVCWLTDWQEAKVPSE